MHSPAAFLPVPTERADAELWSQVYNDSIFDLLDESMPALAGRTSLRLKEDASGRVFVAGLSEVRPNPHTRRQHAEPAD